MIRFTPRTRKGLRDAVLLPLALNGFAGICLFLMRRLLF